MNKSVKPTNTPEFWLRRIYDTLARGRDLHTIIYDTDYNTWQQIQNSTAGILDNLLSPGMKFLDAGCGYGAAYEAWQQYDSLKDVEYVGLDLSPDLLEIAKIRVLDIERPSFTLILGDMRNIPFPDGHFDFVMCRSIKGMVQDNSGDEEWNLIWKELNRVARKILLIEYGDVAGYKVIPSDSAG